MALSILDRSLPDEGDPIDEQLSRLGAAPARVVGRAPWHARLGLAWTSGASPLLLLIIGALLGPSGLAILTPAVQSAVDPGVPVALAVLGVHVALQADLSASRSALRRLAAASLGSLVTALAVAAGLVTILSPEWRAAPLHVWLIALPAGVCAAMSAPFAPVSGQSSFGSAGSVRLELLLPIVLGGLLLAWMREGSLRDAAVILGQMAVLPLVIGAAAWLLLTRIESDSEQRIFTLAALLLVGGLADYLSLSAIFSGLMAGAFWRVTGGITREAVLRDIRYLRHPLAVFLLLLAGARMTELDPGLTLLVAYPVLVLAGGLAGRFVARLLSPGALAPHVPEIISPGVFGIAFAMSAVRTAGPQVEILLGVVTAGTMTLQLLSALRGGGEHHA